MIQTIVHYFFHLVFPFAIAYVFYRPRYLKAYLILVLTMLVDLDHLLADPVFVLCRCSIDFHPLHSYWAIGIYMLALMFPRTRLVAIGLLLHMGTDLLDCYLSTIYCK